MKTLFFLLTFSSIIICHDCFAQQVPSNAKTTAVKQDTSIHYNYKILNSPHNTYGYDVEVSGKMSYKIHQPNIPGMPGNDGFKTKADAEKVAKLVISKIKKGEVPPDVTPEEMKKLKVIK